ncbi:hypothetical protein [Streptomyces chrestomyceticus]|uniref:hypothetical protein n=1 Tax=Streptomyces chrestomyceticus TaxID=68185 RepID=UPI0033F65918
MPRCPRCGGPRILPGRSRITLARDRVICGACCTDEAVRDAQGRAPIPPDRWADA